MQSLRSQLTRCVSLPQYLCQWKYWWCWMRRNGTVLTHSVIAKVLWLHLGRSSLGLLLRAPGLSVPKTPPGPVPLSYRCRLGSNDLLGFSLHHCHRGSLSSWPYPGSLWDLVGCPFLLGSFHHSLLHGPFHHSLLHGSSHHHHCLGLFRHHNLLSPALDRPLVLLLSNPALPPGMDFYGGRSRGDIL